MLVVEDHLPFRRFICSILQEQSGLQIVCELSDGLEAVRQTEKLQPDLILLDIGLPGLSGIEAARRIRRVAPGSKVLFLTLESSPEVVHEALNLGAHGYVLKSEAAGDLLTAVEAVLRGERFVSSALAGRISQVKSPGRFCSNDVLASSTPPESVSRHPVRFYSDDEMFLDDFTCFISGALNAQKAVIVVATESHRASLLERLQGDGVDTAVAVDQKRYISLDAADPLRPIALNDSPEPAGFAKGGRDLIREVANAAAGPRLDLAVG